MIQTIPYSFNKMGVYRSGGSAPPEPPTASIPTANLIWLMDFSNGYLQPYSQINGTVFDDLNGFFNIQTDQQMGTYLEAVSDNGMSYNITWSGSQSYLNNIFTTGLEPFTISFWLKAPQWSSVSQETILSWKDDDDSYGAVIYKDGDSTKINNRVEQAYWFFTNTNADYMNQWNHWVFVRDSNGGAWYCNGVLNNDIPASNNPQLIQNTNVKATTDIMIGKGEYWGCNAYFDLTKIRIYHRALTSSEINTLYTNKA